jgi:hypothetical protein
MPGDGNGSGHPLELPCCHGVLTHVPPPRAPVLQRIQAHMASLAEDGQPWGRILRIMVEMTRRQHHPIEAILTADL